MSSWFNRSRAGKLRDGRLQLHGRKARVISLFLVPPCVLDLLGRFESFRCRPPLRATLSSVDRATRLLNDNYRSKKTQKASKMGRSCNTRKRIGGPGCASNWPQFLSDRTQPSHRRSNAKVCSLPRRSRRQGLTSVFTDLGNESLDRRTEAKCSVRGSRAMIRCCRH